MEKQMRARRPLGSVKHGLAILKMKSNQEVANLLSSYNYF